MHRFDYFAPTTVAEAVNILRSQGEGGKVIAGGTDLVPQMKERGRHPKYVVSLNRIPEIQGIEVRNGQGLRVGAATRCWAIRNHPVVVEQYNILAQGAALIGSIQTQNLATIGGNVCNAIPSADAVPAFIVAGAQARIIGPNGQRTVPLEEVFVGPNRTILAPDEILTDLLIPAPLPRSAGVYLRHCPRKELDIAIAGVGSYVQLDEAKATFTHARICLSAVAPVPLRAPRAEAALIGKPATAETIAAAAQVAAEEARPITDMRGTVEFRRHLVKVLTERTVTQSVEQIRARA
ncbi:MAG: xanthine dehydrogenase family protein subunit M [Chloroflexi bacterium]|nr:xanthine dehydrogenase family protein subunit M [Chloroflexota bacterium]